MDTPPEKSEDAEDIPMESRVEDAIAESESIEAPLPDIRKQEREEEATIYAQLIGVVQNIRKMQTKS